MCVCVCNFRQKSSFSDKSSEIFGAAALWAQFLRQLLIVTFQTLDIIFNIGTCFVCVLLFEITPEDWHNINKLV